MHITMASKNSVLWPGRLLDTKWTRLRPEPRQLYIERAYAGAEKLLSRDYPTIAIVGPRQHTERATKVVVALIQKLSTFEKKPVILSGLCPGIDEVAHRMALQNGLPTVGVLPLTAFSRNRALGLQILNKGGLMVSEFPQETRWENSLYTLRDGITTALADVVVVVQAARASGSIATANRAIAQGKPLWVPEIWQQDEQANPVPYGGIRDLLAAGQARSFTLRERDMSELQTLLAR